MRQASGPGRWRTPIIGHGTRGGKEPRSILARVTLASTARSAHYRSRRQVGHSAQEAGMGQLVHLGVPTVVESAASRTPFAAIFEDDGKVASFYGLDTRLGSPEVVDS